MYINHCPVSQPTIKIPQVWRHTAPSYNFPARSSDHLAGCFAGGRWSSRFRSVQLAPKLTFFQEKWHHDNILSLWPCTCGQAQVNGSWPAGARDFLHQYVMLTAPVPWAPSTVFSIEKEVSPVTGCCKDTVVFLSLSHTTHTHVEHIPDKEDQRF